MIKESENKTEKLIKKLNKPQKEKRLEYIIIHFISFSFFSKKKSFIIRFFIPIMKN